MSRERAIQLVEAGLWLRMSGDLDGARRLFEQALRLDPACERARELLGAQTAAEALPEELQHIPSSTTNLFAVPLPRLVTEPTEDREERMTDPFMAHPEPPAPEPPPPPPPPVRGTPLPAMPPVAPGPFVRGTPLPAAPPVAPGPFVRGTPLPAAPPVAPGPFARGTPLPAPAPSAPPPPEPAVAAALTSPGRETPVPLPSAGAVPPAARMPSGATPLPRGPPAAPPEPAPRGAAAASAAVASDDWWTDGVSTPAPPPKDAWEVGPSQPTTLAPSGPAEGDALTLVAPLPVSAGGTPLPAKMPTDPKREARMLLQRASELQELDDHSGARELLLQAQALDPEAPEVARALAESEQTLQAAYESKLGKLSTVPRVRLREDEVIWLNLDHRAGFILAQIDGTLTFDDLFSVSGMSRLDTARILCELLEQRVIVR